MIRQTFVFLIIIVIKTEAQTSVLNLADSLYANGNYSKAIEQYRLYDKQPDVFDKIAKSYMALGNYEDAIKHYEFSIEAHPKDALLKYEYAKLLASSKKDKEAAKMFNDLVYIDYKNPNYHYELGLVLEKLGDSTAQNRFYNTFQLDSTHQKAIYRLAKYNLQKGRGSLAEKYIDIGLSSYENNKELINLKAQNYFLRKQYEEAVVWFEKLISLNESSEFIHEKLSRSYVKILEYEKAIIHIENALKYNPKNASNLYILGKLYERIEDFQKAEKFIAMSLELQDYPLDDEYVNLGMVLNRQKKYKEALEAFGKAIEENSDNERAHFFLVYTKDQYYKDIETRITIYKVFKIRFPESNFLSLVEYRIHELNKEKFVKEGKKED